ncbi:hypothetical protein BCR36DRAFT_587501 [Piromyces finnis]|uniref:Uncharacterized protein n=1 Tax=Piromyces finnis TaxID=1754191 RepID=A0A1Y1UVQ9_9FUNG|nr:hypothetical protein BCR36DRAFT_587501 [Piromyces finnis]|eukprot:ORX42021.1 hypothetical protein BCR36DRAFT_587501 [Piromyces finnis]
MGLKGKIKGSYLYTQWKLGKYTKRRVKHSAYNTYNTYDDEDMGQGYPVSSSNSYSYPERSPNSYSCSQNSSYNQSYSNDDSNNSYPAGTYNRVVYYPTMDESSRQDY